MALILIALLVFAITELEGWAVRLMVWWLREGGWIGMLFLTVDGPVTAFS